MRIINKKIREESKRKLDKIRTENEENIKSKLVENELNLKNKEEILNDLYSNGNGSLVRILSIALYSYSKSIGERENC